MIYKFLCVDFQNEWVDKKGLMYNGGQSIEFIINKLVPFLKKNKVKASEIISDYRRPRRMNQSKESCVPGSFGYQSSLTEDVKTRNVWIKSGNSPIWIRKNIGIPNTETDEPYQDPTKFEEWLYDEIGCPNNELTVIVFGLTLDCCVLCAVQELYWRGYNVKVLPEATDVMPNKKYDKNVALGVLNHWIKIIEFEEIEKEFHYDK